MQNNTPHITRTIIRCTLVVVHLCAAALRTSAATEGQEAAAVSAPTLTHLDWDEMHIDSLLPQYTEVVPLESDYRLYDYKVNILYPEWKVLTEREQKVAERYADQIADTLTIDTHVGVMRRRGTLDIAFVPIIRRDGRYVKLISCQMDIVPVLKPAARRASTTNGSNGSNQRFASKSLLSEGRWVKISITTDGMYRLTRSALQSMGFSNLDNVHLYGYGGHLQNQVMAEDAYFDDLVETPLVKVDDNTWVFWGNGLVHWNGTTRLINNYAREACYFLTETTTANQVTNISSSATPTKTYTTFPDHTLYEKDGFAYFWGGRHLYDTDDYATSSTHTYSLSTTDSQGDEKLTIAFTAASTSQVKLQPYVNGSALSATTITALADYCYATLSTKTTDVSQYRTGANWTVKLTSTAGQTAHLDYLALHYTRALRVPESGYVAFSQTASGSGKLQIACTPSQTRLLRVAKPGQTSGLIATTTVGSSCEANVDDVSDRFVAFDVTKASSFPEPQLMGTIENQNLHALSGVDMVIIVPESGKLMAQANRLAEAHKTYDSLKVAIVRADQVYNEFSSGTKDATAYRLFMKMLYDRVQTDGAGTLKYLLLMGDCAWDNRMLTSTWKSHDPKDYLLCFESENSVSDTKCYVMEDYFGILDDGEGSSLTSDKVDIGVGRFPVTTEAEAKIMVDKCIAYMSNQNAGSWKNVVSILGDDGDDNEHMKYADDVAERIMKQNPDLEVRKTMWDQYARKSTTTNNTFPEVTELVGKQMAEGALMVNYTGHGSYYCLSHEMVLKLEHFRNYKGSHLPLWVTAACDVMPFDGVKENIGEVAVLNEGGAALAFYGTTRTVYAYNNLQMNRYLTQYLFGTDSEGKRYRLGDAIRLAKTMLISNKAEVSNTENKLHYALLGDPALTIGEPLNKVVLDSINGVSAQTGDSLMLKAGQRVRMVGHVQNAAGERLKGFKGVVTARVYDSQETITCLNNAGTAKNKFTFSSRENVLYTGQDSVKAGEFVLEFVMPTDINYSNQSGRVVFYAINEALKVEANGHCERFNIGGVEPDVTDTIGPKIYAYLNHENFQNGETVPASSLFMAQLEDESGVSYTGNGIGHDLQLTIDNDPATTFNLNEYYSGEFGDFTKGTVCYTMPTLTEGPHSLTFRAWDVLNNTSTTTLDFNVSNSLRPNILKLSASQNPAKTTTNFLISYDMPGAECEFQIDVYDFSGRRMWTYTTTTSTSTGLLSVPWNLCNGSGGRLYAGIYLYKATVKQGDSKKVSEAQKIIVMRQ